MTSPTNESTQLAKNSNQNLYDGLLASGFDEESCISRFVSYSYRKASPHKPSSYLISKLRSYEEIHRRCGPRTIAYSRTMKQLLRSTKHSTDTTCKYLVWTPANGLGNRMISMAATFLYAVLTDRVLLVKFEDEMKGLFCEPFLNSTWELPRHSPYWDPKDVETYQSMIKNKNIPSVLHMNLQHQQRDPEKFFHCDRSQKLVQKVPFLILQTDQYFVPSLFMVSSFDTELTHMFPEKDTVFHHLGRYLFHPSNEAWGIISRFYDAYLRKSEEKIGLQIRLFTPKSTPHQAVLDLLLTCTLKHKLLPELAPENSDPPIRVGNLGLKAVLVASLFPEYGEKLRSMYLMKPTTTGDAVAVYQASHEEQQKFHDNMHNMKAWTEMYLLSLCDVLVTTSLSTFGYVAQGLGGLKPWLLYRLVGNQTYYDPPCERDFSMEPCYHIPPRHDCEGNEMTHFSSAFAYMRGCMDYYYGVKMVNVSG